MKLIEHLVGAPMAAPETPAMRRLRRVFTGFAAASGAAILGLQLLIALLGEAGSGAIVLVLLGATLGLGLTFFTRKARIDDAWLRARGIDSAGEGP